MMTLGTTGAFGFEDFHPPEVIGLYAQAGCEIVQVYRNRQRNIPARDILAVTADLPVRVDSLHGHFGDDLDPSSEDETVRRTTVDLYRQEADYCRALGGDLVVVHPSPAQAPPGRLDARYDQLQRSFADLARIGEQTRVRFAFENMPPYHPVGNDVARLVHAIVAAASPFVVFLLDVGHAHMTDRADAAARIAGTHLAYTHVHDNDGKNDSHILPYRGTVCWDDLRRSLHEIRYNGVFLLEVFERADDLRRLLDDRWKANIQAILANGLA